MACAPASAPPTGKGDATGKPLPSVELSPLDNTPDKAGYPRMEAASRDGASHGLDGSAMSPLRSQGPQHRGTKSEVAASPLPSLGPKRGRKCYVTPAFSGVPKQGDKVKGGPQVGGSAT